MFFLFLSFLFFLLLPTLATMWCQNNMSSEFLMISDEQYSSPEWTSHLTATRRYLPYGITQFYLAFNTSELAAPNPSQIGWYSAIYLPRRDGRLSWPKWLVTFRVVTHPSSNRGPDVEQLRWSRTTCWPNHYTTPPPLGSLYYLFVMYTQVVPIFQSLSSSRSHFLYFPLIIGFSKSFVLITWRKKWSFFRWTSSLFYRLWKFHIRTK